MHQNRSRRLWCTGFKSKERVSACLFPPFGSHAQDLLLTLEELQTLTGVKFNTSCPCVWPPTSGMWKDSQNLFHPCSVFFKHIIFLEYIFGYRANHHQTSVSSFHTDRRDAWPVWQRSVFPIAGHLFLKSKKTNSFANYHLYPELSICLIRIEFKEVSNK